jgi:membrane-associated protease RseP (regulator of RpoE activity)
MAIYGQPMISRETRRLLLTIVVSIAALWVLARIRFQERAAASTPMPTVLAQLRPAAAYADLAGAIADIRPAILAAVSASGGSTVLRIGEHAGVTLAPMSADAVIASDRATGLAIVRRPRSEISGLMPWAPRLLDYPRYLVAADAASGSVTLRPVFVGGLFPSPSPLWSGELWVLPSSTALAPGTFVFTIEGALAGLSVSHRGGPALVPAGLLSAAWQRLQQQRPTVGEIGVVVQQLTPAISSATGASTGVVVSAVDSAGAAAGKLVPTEIVEAIDGQEVPTPDHWRARVARVTEGEDVTLRVRNHEGVREVRVIAGAAPAAAKDDPSLGLRLRTIPRVGAEVLSVQAHSRGAGAGLRQGDVITVAGGKPAPTSTQLTRAFNALPDGGSLLVAVTRGRDHHVAVLEQ